MSFGSGHGSAPNRRQTITRTNDGYTCVTWTKWVNPISKETVARQTQDGHGNLRHLTMRFGLNIHCRQMASMFRNVPAITYFAICEFANISLRYHVVKKCRFMLTTNILLVHRPHYSVPWASWRLKSPVPLLFASRFVQVNNNTFQTS